MNLKLRIAFVTYGLPSTRPSPILCKRYFSKPEVLKRDSLEIPELVGLGQISNEESERDGMAMLDAFACALEVSSPHEPYPFNSPGTHPHYRCLIYWTRLQPRIPFTSSARSFTLLHTRRITHAIPLGTSAQTLTISHGATYHKNWGRFVHYAIIQLPRSSDHDQHVTEEHSLFELPHSAPATAREVSRCGM